MRTRTIISLISLMSLLLAACSPGEELAEQMIESQEGAGDIEIDIEDGQVRAEGEDEGGSFSIGGGEIPDNFPIDVLGGGTVQAVIESGDETSITLTYADDFDSVRNHYENWAESHGEIVQMTETSDPQQVFWIVDDADGAYQIGVADVGQQGTQVTLGWQSSG